MRLESKLQNKYYDYYLLLNHWLEAKNYGHDASEYFEDEDFKYIAIYGMGDLANRLSEDLEKSKVKVRYGIDKDIANSVSRISDVFTLEDELEKVDAVIVTPFFEFDQIKEQLCKNFTCPIISLEEVIWSI